MQSGECDGEWGVGSVMQSMVCKIYHASFFLLCMFWSLQLYLFTRCDLPCQSEVLLMCETSFH